MLIVTRKKGEKIIIGEPFKTEIVVLDMKVNEVRLGFSARRDLRIYREELRRNKKTEKNA